MIDDLDFVVEDAESGKPLDSVLRGRTKQSWGKVRQWIQRGKVTVDGIRMLDPVKWVRVGSTVSLKQAARRYDPDALEDDRIVYLDSHVVVVRKPAGISTIPYEEGERGTLEDKTRQWLVRHGKHAPNDSLGVVHRIDKETSGLVVFTRTQAAKKVLSQAFRVHVIERRYIAIVHGAIVGKRTFRSNLVEDRGDGLRGSAKDRNMGQPSVTHVAAVEHLEKDDATLLACALETGRTHQIRIHLSEARHPLVGDRVYTRDWIRDGHKLLEAPRMMLHAMILGFEHPISKKPLRFADPPPEDFLKTATKLAGRTVRFEPAQLPI
jgi:23S rRNA pseudouridine1911/1915/1917 synthase